MPRTEFRRCPALFLTLACIAFTIGLSVLPSTAQAQACIDYGSFMGWIGGAPAPGPVVDVALSGETAFLACYQDGLQVMDVSDPESPVLIGGVACNADMIALTASRACIMGTTDHLFLVADVSDPAAPEILGSLPIQGNVYAVTALGNYAYLANYNQGAQVIDISDPASPSIIAVFAPHSRVLTGYGDRIYVIEQWEDISLHVFDVADPAHPVLLGSGEIPYDNYNALSIYGGTLYAACGDGLRTFDVSDPQQPRFIGLGGTLELCWDVAVFGSHAFLAGWDGLFSFDVSDPSSPAAAGFVESDPQLVAIDVTASKAFAAAQDDGLLAADVSIPMDPFLIGSVDLPGDAQGVAVSGDYALMACVDEGLRIVDATDPSAPVEVASLTVSGTPEDVAVLGTYAYVVGGSTQLTVVDISDPEHPGIVVAKILGGGACSGIAIQGGYAYVANWLAGLQIVDLSDPANPVYVGGIDLPGYSEEIAVVGHTAYVACRAAGLAIVDVTDPEAPVLLGAFDLENATDVAVSGGFAYVADASTVKILDVTDPAHPAYVIAIPFPTATYGVALWANSLYATGWHGLAVIDVTDPAAYVRLGSIDTPGQGFCVTAKRGYVWVADGEEGLRIAPLQCGGQTSAPEAFIEGAGVDLVIAPNPAGGERIEFRFTLARSEHVTATVFDPSGRRVARLADGIRAAGPQSIMWNGRDDHGRPMPSGVYTCRIRTAGGTAAQKAVLSR